MNQIDYLNFPDTCNMTSFISLIRKCCKSFGGTNDEKSRMLRNV